jgi:hypothetical protein
LHHPDRAGRRLQASVLEALHLKVEAVALTGGAPDQVLARHVPVVERDLVAVHPAVTDGVDRASFHRAALGLSQLEAVALATILGHDEQRQPAVALRTIRVSAGEQHQHVGAGRERAPRLNAAYPPASPVRLGHDAQASDVRAEVRLGHGDRAHDLPGGQPGEPGVLLFLRAARHQRAAEDLRSRDQAPADAQRAARQFLGRPDHRQVLALALRREPTVPLRDRHPEGAELRQSFDDSLRDVDIVAMDLLGHRTDLVLRKAPERVLDQPDVRVQMTRPLLAAELREEPRVATGANELGGAVERARLDPPCGLTPQALGGEFVNNISDERARKARLRGAALAVLQHRARGLDRRRRVRHVVRDDLFGVDVAG